MAETLLRLDVWRPMRLNKRLVYEAPDAGASINELLSDRLHELIYSWKLKGDVWTSLSVSAESSDLREFFTTKFNFGLPPEERSFIRLKEFNEKLSACLKNPSNRLWQSWEQILIEDEPNAVFQTQPLLALHQHLSWVYEIFKDVPGVSVTIQ